MKRISKAAVLTITAGAVALGSAGGAAAAGGGDEVVITKQKISKSNGADTRKTAAIKVKGMKVDGHKVNVTANAKGKAKVKTNGKGKGKKHHHSHGKGSSASAKAIGSPGAISGNVIQVPVNVPINVCGNTVDVIALLNPSFGGICVNK
ncbi:chaplin [Streptomyces sp. XD-27]|uniref:chaplin n=1 Tax=Streptomyces sp. XD-27 TaxID=3062779 RepID=UPI0026F4425B|nr:chaplin [Streptomyces sp. XD-27]WKX70169.1 chaplin [Streptomyces sp. XD-27]